MRAWRRDRSRSSPERDEPARSTWFGRVLRGWRLDRNPLRRRSDRAETVILSALLIAFLAGAPLAALAAGSWAHAESVRLAQDQRAASHQVRATLQTKAQLGVGSYASEAMAQWKAPDGEVRTGEVAAPEGTAAGSTVMIWVNQAGQLTAPPLDAGQIAGRSDLAGGLAVAVVAVVLIVAGSECHWALNRRRMARWDAGWLAAGSRWSPGGRTPAGGD